MVEYRPWPARPDYLAGSDGTVIGAFGRVLRPTLGRRGYYIINIRVDGRRLTRPVHVVVAEAWHGPRPDGYDVAHGNGNRLDNRPSNLRWATRAANHADKRHHGTHLQGEKSYAAKLTDDAVVAIRKAYREGVSQVDLARRYGLSSSTICQVVQGKRWSHVPHPEGPLPDGNSRKAHYGEEHPLTRLTNDDIRAIRSAYAGGVPGTQLAKAYGASKSCIYRILRREVWGHVA